MGSSRRFCLLVLAAVAGLAAVAAAQEFPAPGHDPRGVVLDEQLVPIAGAEVALLWDTDPEQPFARSTAQRLARTPLPVTRSGRDGTFVLPLTEEQRALGDPGWNASGCWLVVKKAGYRTWSEPVRSGPRSYLGSRVILRAERADDPFADVPWPPAIVTMRCESSMLPWLPVGSPMPELDRRGASDVLEDRASVAAARFGLLRLRVTGGDRSLSHVAVSFSDDAHRGTSAGDALPLRTGADGAVEVRLPAGRHEARFFAPGYLAQSVELAVAAGKRGERTVELVPAEAVDVLAVTPAGVPVPFVRLDVVPKDGNTDARSSFFVFTDSLGRARLFVDAADEWFVYGDFGQQVERFPLDRDQAGEDGVVRVTKKQPVTLRIRGDRWPRTGCIHWCDAHGETHRGFDFEEPAADAVVMRLCYRDDAATRVAGDAGVPFVILHSELPPAPAEPLLDLVEIDRTLRPRARLAPRPAAGLRLFRFAVRPTWQPEARTRADSVMFNVRQDGGWMLYARDDAAFEAIATAARHENARISVPRRAPDAGLPVLDFEFVAR